MNEDNFDQDLEKHTEEYESPEVESTDNLPPQCSF